MSEEKRSGGWVDNLSDKTMNIIVICAVSAVILLTVLCVVLQNCTDDSALGGASGSASGSASGEPDGISESSVIIFPDETEPSFKAPVAAGSYINAGNGNTLSVSKVDKDGFDFVLTAGGTPLSKRAKFSAAYDYASYAEGANVIRFTFAEGLVRLGLSGSVSALGMPGAAVVDGEYKSVVQSATQTTLPTVETAAPTTSVTTSAAQAAATTSSAPAVVTTAATTTAAAVTANSLDVGMRNNATVQATLKSLMGADFALMNSIFATGSEQIGASYPDVTTDKNGVVCRCDNETKSIKYEYVVNNGTGQRVLLLCSATGKVYVGICDGAAFRYYTNDSAKKTSAPECITGTAAGMGMTVTYK